MALVILSRPFCRVLAVEESMSVGNTGSMKVMLAPDGAMGALVNVVRLRRLASDLMLTLGSLASEDEKDHSERDSPLDTRARHARTTAVTSSHVDSYYGTKTKQSMQFLLKKIRKHGR